MDAAAIAAAYDSIADRWLDDRFGRDVGVALHRRALGFLGPLTAGRALNVGCGCNSRFSLLFKERELHIEGLDVSPRMLELATHADPDLQVHLADVRAWTPPHRYEFISAWDSIWHVPLAAQRDVMHKLMGALAAGGVFIFSAGGLDVPDEHVDSSMGPALCYSTLGLRGIVETVSEAGCVCRHLEFDQLPSPHVVVIVQKIA